MLADVDPARMAHYAAGANDTTRHMMASTLDLFQKHPDQLTYLMADFDGRIDVIDADGGSTANTWKLTWLEAPGAAQFPGWGRK